MTDKKGNIVYPDNYGGEYIEDGVLIITLANASDDEKNSYLELLDKFRSAIQIKDVEYSINELNSIADDVIKNMDASIKKSFYINPRDNQVVITVPQKSLDTQTSSLTIKNASQDLPVKIEAQQDVIPTTSLYGGDPIANDSDEYTLGICGTYGGYPAILTAGHGWTSLNEGLLYIVDDYAEIGYVVKYQFSNGGYGDYAVCRITDSSCPTTNKVYSDTTSYSIKGKLSLPVGGLGYRYGASCMGVQALEVTALNTSETYDGKTVKGMVTTKHISGQYCVLGDSGGPFYAMNSSSQWCIVGTTAAKGTAGANQKVVISPIGLVSGFTVKTN